MKKTIIGLMLSVFAMFFVACGDDDGSKADLKWKNGSGAKVKDIRWNEGETTWDGDCADDAETDFKGIKNLTGKGDAVDSDGDTATIEIADSGNEHITKGDGDSAIVEKNSAALIKISGTAKK